MALKANNKTGYILCDKAELVANRFILTTVCPHFFLLLLILYNQNLFAHYTLFIFLTCTAIWYQQFIIAQLIIVVINIIGHICMYTNFKIQMNNNNKMYLFICHKTIISFALFFVFVFLLVFVKCKRQFVHQYSLCEQFNYCMNAKRPTVCVFFLYSSSEILLHIKLSNGKIMA